MDSSCCRPLGGVVRWYTVHLLGYARESTVERREAEELSVRCGPGRSSPGYLDLLGAPAKML